MCKTKLVAELTACDSCENSVILEAYLAGGGAY